MAQDIGNDYDMETDLSLSRGFNELTMENQQSSHNEGYLSQDFAVDNLNVNQSSNPGSRGILNLDILRKLQDKTDILDNLDTERDNNTKNQSIRRSSRDQFEQSDMQLKKLHIEALREINNSKPTFEVLNEREERVVELMIKNVSQDTKLTPMEAEELRAIRSKLGTDKWNQWLSYAREEKRRREATRYSTPVFGNSYSNQPTSDNDDYGNNEDQGQYDTPAPIVVNNGGRGGAVGRPPIPSRGNANRGNNSAIGTSAPTDNAMNNKHVKSNSNINKFNNSQMKNNNGAANKDLTMSALQSTPRGAQLKQNDDPYYENFEDNYMDYDNNNHNNINRPMQQRYHAADRRYAPPQSNLSIDVEDVESQSESQHSDNNDDAQDPEAQENNYFEGGAFENPIMFKGDEIPRVSLSGSLSNFVVQVARSNSPLSKPGSPEQNWSRGNQLLEGQVPLSASSNLAQTQRSSSSSRSVARPPLFGSSQKAIIPASGNEVQQIVKSSTMRIDSAYAAAKCLLQSMRADEGGDSPSKVPTDATITILEAMVKTLEKSKASLEQISPSMAATVNSDGDAWKNNPSNIRNSGVNAENDPSVFGDPRDAMESFHKQDFQSYRVEKPLSMSRSATPSSTMKRTEFRQSLSDSLTQAPPIIASVAKSRIKESSTVEGAHQPTLSHTPSRLHQTMPARIGQNLGNSQQQHPFYQHQQSHNFSNHHSSGNQEKTNGSGQFDVGLHGYTMDGKVIRDMQAVITRVCVSYGPTVKAFEEFPIRVDVESASADLVWRESRPDGGRSTTLRRERFVFDNVFAGPGSLARLNSLVRSRQKKALFQSKNLVFLALGCGESYRDALEPTLSTVLGESGGRGVISACVDEIFRFCTPLSSKTSMSQQASSSFVSTKIKFEQDNACVTLSAIIQSQGRLVDLLRPATVVPNSQQRVHIARNSFGQYSVVNATQVSLKNLADYERVVGVLLGRRSALKEMAVARSQFANYDFRGMRDSAWLFGDGPSTAWFTVNVSFGGINGNSGHSLSYQFVCPCGEKWGSPGPEITMLSEGICTFPHSPPPSLIKSSALVAAILSDDAKRYNTEFINIAVVNRCSHSGDDDKCSSPVDTSRDMPRVVSEALDTMRILSYLN